MYPEDELKESGFETSPMDLPRITVITPSFNQGCFIQQTIDSILSQGYPNLEYIVMDGGSTDNTVSILSQYSQKLIWFSEKDRGQSHAINKGLKIATGDIVTYLNSDDTYLPDSLWKVGKYFKAHPEAMWLTGKCQIIDENMNVTRKLITFYKNFWLRSRSYLVLLILDYISQPSTFWRKSLIDEVGLFDESLRYVLDYDYWLRIGKHYPLHVLPHDLACFRVHSSSKTSSAPMSKPAELMSSEEELNAALRYSRSNVERAFINLVHKFHRYLTVFVYRRIKT